MLSRASKGVRSALPTISSVGRRNVSLKVGEARLYSSSPDPSWVLQNIVYGSPEAKEAGEVEQHQHSKIVARQKYLHVFECEQRVIQHCLLMVF